MPVIADANSMTYVLHKALGDDIVIEQDGRPVRLASSPRSPTVSSRAS